MFKNFNPHAGIRQYHDTHMLLQLMPNEGHSHLILLRWLLTSSKCKYHNKDTEIEGVESEYCHCPEFVGFPSSDLLMSQAYVYQARYCDGLVSRSTFRHTCMCNCMPSCFMLPKLDLKFE